MAFDNVMAPFYFIGKENTLMAVVTGLNSKDEENAVSLPATIVKSMDDIADKDEPFPVVDSDGEMAIVGDPNKIEVKNSDILYEFQLVLPYSKFNPSEFPSSDVVEGDSKVYFKVSVKAKQEPVVSMNRTRLTILGSTVISMLFEQDKNGQYELIGFDDDDPDNLTRRMSMLIKFFENDSLLVSCKKAIGEFLGLDRKYVNYIHDIEVPALIGDLIANNPDIFNEAYFTLG